MRFQRLRRSEWIVGAGSVVLLASTLLLPWYGARSVAGPAGARTIDGWHADTHLRWLILVTVVAGFALVLAQATRRAPAVPVTLSLPVMVLGALSALWLIYRVPIDPGGGRKLGGWIALLSACAITYGGYRSLRTEGIAARDGPATIPTVSPWAEGHS